MHNNLRFIMINVKRSPNDYQWQKINPEEEARVQINTVTNIPLAGLHVIYIHRTCILQAESYI